MNRKRNEISFFSTLERLSNHLDMLAGRIYDVEAELGSLLSTTDGSESLSITKIQSLDFARQSLEDCSILMLMIKRHSKIDFNLKIDLDSLDENLKLDSTRQLIIAKKVNHSVSKEGDFDLF